MRRSRTVSLGGAISFVASATPLLIVGLKMPDNKLVITTTEDLRNDEVALLLAEAITMICPGGVNS